MIFYIGDVSKKDAEIIKSFAEKSNKILEFGCGASTQIIANYSSGEFISIDTDEGWIERTKKNFEILEINKSVKFYNYNKFMSSLNEEQVLSFDFIFDDGVDHLRKDFGFKVWPFLKIGGTLAFHDTRRNQDFNNVLEIMRGYQNEIGEVFCNYKSSNITLITKKQFEPYDNWNFTEKKEKWMFGHAEPDLEYIKNKKFLEEK